MLKSAMEKVLILGGGITGATVAAEIRQDLQKTVSISVWDKGRGLGGRMATSRCNKDANCTVDLGAQYISATPEYLQKHQKYYNEVLQAAILEPVATDIDGNEDRVQGTKHFVAPNGISSLVKYYMNKSEASVKRQTLVTDVSIATDKVKVTTDQGHSEEFDALVITAPVPQILKLQGDIANHIDKKNIRPILEAVSYSSRFAVGLFYSPGTTIDVPWGAKYITGNPSIRFVSIDDRKRNKANPSVGPSICVHTGAPWGLENIERDKDEAAVDILKHLANVLPGLPEPVEVKGHKWRFSQIHKSYAGRPGCVVLSEKPTIILAGDAFTHSNFDGCLDSTQAVHQALNNIYKSKVKL